MGSAFTKLGRVRPIAVGTLAVAVALAAVFALAPPLRSTEAMKLVPHTRLATDVAAGAVEQLTIRASSVQYRVRTGGDIITRVASLPDGEEVVISAGGTVAGPRILGENAGIDPAKAVEPLLKILTALGGLVVFAWGLIQWREQERGKRAERLETIISFFESSPLLRLAVQAIDYNKRKYKFDDELLEWNSNVVKDALRVHTRYRSEIEFPYPQALLRDAFDALLGFNARLEVAIAGGLVDEQHAIDYFGYYLRRMHDMDEHQGEPDDAQERMARYEQAYGDPRLINSLYERVGRRRLSVGERNVIRLEVKGAPPQQATLRLRRGGDPKSPIEIPIAPASKDVVADIMRAIGRSAPRLTVKRLKNIVTVASEPGDSLCCDIDPMLVGTISERTAFGSRPAFNSAEEGGPPPLVSPPQKSVDSG